MTDSGVGSYAEVTQGNREVVGRGSWRQPWTWWAAAQCHSLLVVAGVAALARLLALTLLGPLQSGYLLPDEAQYLALARFVASGRGAEAYEPGYGQELFDTTAAFMVPLSALVRVFGEHQILGQLIAATFGTLTAVLTTVLASRVVRRALAMAAGGIVALMPSQVLWSSVALRESMVWASLVVVALGLSLATTARGPRRLAACACLLAMPLYALAHLRPLTAVVTGAAVVLTVLAVRHCSRLLVPVGALVLVALVPLASGLGIAGYGFVEANLSQLAVVRTALSLNADSAFVKRDQTRATDPANRPRTVLKDSRGRAYEVDGTPSANLSALPRGLVAVTLRPFPWESSSSLGMTVAKLENVVWCILYVLAGFGVYAGWRHRRHLIFLVVATGGLLVVAAVTQGNLGTAFRHRGQLLWAVAILAVIGIHYLSERRATKLEPTAPADR